MKGKKKEVLIFEMQFVDDVVEREREIDSWGFVQSNKQEV